LRAQVSQGLIESRLKFCWYHKDSMIEVQHNGTLIRKLIPDVNGFSLPLSATHSSES
jgi:hypothetical protein